MELRARYNPPGTVVLAVLATIACGFLAFAVAEALGFAVAPGIILWYAAIRFLRRHHCSFNLSSSKAIVVDAKNHRMAFFTRMRKTRKLGWVAFQIKDAFPEVAEIVSKLPTPKRSERHIGRTGIMTACLLGIVVALIVALIVRNAWA